MRSHFQFGRFLVVGGGNFILTMGAYAAALDILGLHYLAALAGAWFIGVNFSYWANALWVFRVSRPQRNANSFAKFFLTSGVSVLANALILATIVEGIALDPFTVQLCLVPFIVALNFVATKFWSMRAGGDTARINGRHE